MKEAFLGIDISKNTFDVALLTEDKVKTQKFNNNEQGFHKLLIWLNQKKVMLSQTGMEATGAYADEIRPRQGAAIRPHRYGRTSLEIIGDYARCHTI